jgi:hypothetical protein
MTDRTDSLINWINGDLQLKSKVRETREVFCEVKQKKIQLNQTIEVNLGKTDIGIEKIRDITLAANKLGYDVEFFNGNPFIQKYRKELKSEGINI